MINQTASEVRYQECRKQRAYALLAEHPHLQAQAIADHYAAYATVAMQIQRLLQGRQSTDIKDDATATMINYLLVQIMEGHKNDLGIALEWKGNNEH